MDILSLLDLNMPRIFFDTSVILSATLSRAGASHALVVLAEIGLLRALTCDYVWTEVERNIYAKMPQGFDRFQQLKTSVLATAINAKPDRLVTLDHRDFLRSRDVIQQQVSIKIVTPGQLMQNIRMIFAKGFKVEG